jgi:NAD(P)-dependent dehydrogenase (short-subunit alcohol dehydrogenase family)
LALSFEDRTVVVTGAASGIGAATARLLHARGARVAKLDRAWPQGAVASQGDDRLSVTSLDVTDERGVVRCFEEIAGRWGPLHGLATCAGIVDASDFLALDAATFRKIHDVNVVGTFSCMREAALRMTPGARIVTVSSVAGIRGGGLFGTAAYAASKGAVLALSKSASRALGPRGIAVNCVAPGPTETTMTAPAFGNPALKDAVTSLTALGRTASADEIAEAIAWLLSPASSYVNGATLVVDGGLVMM